MRLQNTRHEWHSLIGHTASHWEDAGVNEGGSLQGVASEAEPDFVDRIVKALGLLTVWLQNRHLHVVGQGQVRYADAQVTELLLAWVLP